MVAMLDKGVREGVNRAGVTMPWVSYAAAGAALARMEALLAGGGERGRRNLLIVSEAKNGKTAVARQFIEAHPARDAGEGKGVCVPALLAGGRKGTPALGRAEILRAVVGELFAFGVGDDEAEAEELLPAMLARTGVSLQMLVFDRLQTLPGRHRGRERTEALETMMRLGERLNVPIVGLGTPLAADVLGSHPATAGKFDVMTLPAWRLDEEFVALLEGFEHAIPLPVRSRLTGTAGELFEACEGRIGKLARTLREAAVWMKNSGGTHVNRNVLLAMFEGDAAMRI